MFCLIVYEQLFLIRRYDFKIGKIQISVVADECETCMLDYPINNIIKIKDTQDRIEKSFEFNTEGPRLEFGLNQKENELVINCPGFSSKFIRLKNLTEIDVDYDLIDNKLNDFKVNRIISKDKKLIFLKTGKAPDKNWD